MKKNIGNILFCIAFVVMLLIPLVTMDFEQGKVSEIDNEYLPELPEKLSRNIFSEMDLYVSKRIGLRKESLDLYQKINSSLFDLLEHPLYIYGEDGYVFYNADGYMQDYQHLNLDENYAKEFIENINELKSIAESAGKKFYYLLIPDKKTIYYEYYPKGINVYGDISRTDLILDEISNTDIKYLYAKDLLLEAKKYDQIYNVKYDAGHWNEKGAFITIQKLLEMVKEDFPELYLLNKANYDETVKLETSLQVSRFQIHEEVPLFTLKEDASEICEMHKEDAVIKEESYFYHFINKNNENAPKVLIFNDSYMMDKEKFFTPSFSEAVFIHRNTLSKSKENFSHLIELFNPDIIIYENCERVFPIEFNE